MKSFWSNLHPKNQVIAVYVFTTIMTVILFSWTTVPLLRLSYDKIALFISLRKQIDEAPHWDAISQKMQKEIVQLQRQLDSAGESVLGIQTDSGIISLLNNAAKSNGIRIEMLKPLQHIENNRIEIAATGSFHDIGHFIYDIEKCRTMIWINACNLSAAEKRQGPVHAMIHFGFQNEEGLYAKKPQ